MEAISKTGKIFKGDLATLFIKIGIAEPLEVSEGKAEKKVQPVQEVSEKPKRKYTKKEK
jgi:hypothetical protein